MGRIVALDPGIRKWGVAWTDPSGKIPFPGCTLPTEKLVPWLEEYVRQHPVEALVVGRAVHPHSGEPARLWLQIQPILAEIHRRTSPIPLYVVDESFTSRWALTQIQLYGEPSGGKQRRVDALAASQILETFLHLKEQGLPLEKWTPLHA